MPAAEISPTGSSGSSARSADPSTISGQNEEKSRTSVVEMDSTNEDQLVCVDCSAQFPLSEIARFIQHKVRNTGHFRGGILACSQSNVLLVKVQDCYTKVQLKTIETGCFLEITFDTGIVDP